MIRYKHLTLEEREEILKYSAQGLSLGQIATKLGRHKSIVSRELKRNSLKDRYSPSAAHTRYKKRRLACRPHKILEDPIKHAWVKQCFLEHQWSPEQIEGRLKLEQAGWSVSFSTVYRAIYSSLFDEPNLSHGCRGVIRKLRHRGKSRHSRGYVEKRGKMPISNELKDRPEEANRRKRLGDWEGDTVIGKTGRACLVTYVDRKSRYLKSKKVSEKKSIHVRDATIELLKDGPLHTVTPDRGKEFARHEEMSAALNKVKFYFPLPRHPWDRGTNENTNGLLREYFPKGADLNDISDEYIQSKVDEINRRPRKCLGYRTPYEVYYSVTLHLV